ncbi:hypothetical protein QUA43_05520 [Microcoleus sp. N9_B4]|uniref:hypothetical protein n=1 Tax=Microcoleus sp. N9_B4 TaxID=3055386 RepID=UPI002FD5E0EE
MAVGNAIGRTDKTRRLKPLLHKLSSQQRGTKEGILKSDLVTVNSQLTTVNSQQSTDNSQLTTVNSQQSTDNSQLTTVN